MKFLTYLQGNNGRPALARDDQVALDLLAADSSLPFRWNELFRQSDRIAELAHRWLPDPGTGPVDVTQLEPPLFALSQVPLLPPILQPSKIIAVGLNYRDHAAEQGRPLPEAPLLFAKAPSCLQRPTGPIVLAADLDRVDAEAELAVVIGKPGRAIPREHVREFIGGYMCFNDISDRTAQYADKQWFRGKSIDTGGPCGPWIVTPDELPDLATGLAITARWNDETMQSSNTDQLIFPVDELISYISRNMTPAARRYHLHRHPVRCGRLPGSASFLASR
ncbi:MAG: fumarylacetoacetate hydrolase family protein [bacterium]